MHGASQAPKEQVRGRLVAMLRSQETADNVLRANEVFYTCDGCEKARGRLHSPPSVPRFRAHALRRSGVLGRGRSVARLLDIERG